MNILKIKKIWYKINLKAYFYCTYSLTCFINLREGVQHAADRILPSSNLPPLVEHYFHAAAGGDSSKYSDYCNILRI
jgi:hypothetical protein